QCRELDCDAAVEVEDRAAQAGAVAHRVVALGVAERSEFHRAQSASRRVRRQRRVDDRDAAVVVEDRAAHAGAAAASRELECERVRGALAAAVAAVARVRGGKAATTTKAALPPATVAPGCAVS